MRIQWRKLNNTLLKAFTIKNVITHLIILNPDKILTQVQDTISTLEFNLKVKLPNSLKIGIYIHVSCMVERLVIRQPLFEYTRDRLWRRHRGPNRHFHPRRHQRTGKPRGPHSTAEAVDRGKESAANWN